MVKAKKDSVKKLLGKVQRNSAAKSAHDDGSFPSPVATVERRKPDDRRKSDDRRKETTPVAVERRAVERRTKVSRRRQIDPTTCERDYTPEEIEFMGALDDYKRTSGRMFPTCSEILEVIRKLGYQKLVAESISPCTDTFSGASQQTAV